MNEHIQPTAILLETQYLPAVSVFVTLQSFSRVLIDVHEPFQKSTFRNRCRIMGANGPILLTIPVEGGRGVRKPVKDVRINYEESWQRNHWGSIFSAYGRSSYFEFYADQFKPFYERRIEFLIDFNMELMMSCLKIVNIKAEILKTEVSAGFHEENIFDARNIKNNIQNLVPYHQVFEEKHGFIPNLSIIDLIFNMGPESKLYLNKI